MKSYACLIVSSILCAQSAFAGSPITTTQCPAGAGNKVVVCHFDAESAAWLPLLLPPGAVKNHLNNHDDALAGGITSDSATQLDEDCVAAAAPTNPTTPQTPNTGTGNSQNQDDDNQQNDQNNSGN